MVCDFCLRPTGLRGCCRGCFSVIADFCQGDRAAQYVHELAMERKAIRNAGGERAYLRQLRSRVLAAETEARLATARARIIRADAIKAAERLAAHASGVL